MTPDLASQDHPDVRLTDPQLVADRRLAVSFCSKASDASDFRFGQALLLLGLLFGYCLHVGGPHIWPENPSADLADVRIAKPEVERDAPLGFTGELAAPDLGDDIFVDPCVPVVFAGRLVVETCRRGASVVLLGRYVLKVLCSVVSLVRVQMVNVMSLGTRADERSGNESVDETTSLPPVAVVKADREILAAFGSPTPSTSQRGLHDVSLLAAVTVESSDAPLVADFVQALVPNYRKPPFTFLLSHTQNLPSIFRRGGVKKGKNSHALLD